MAEKILNNVDDRRRQWVGTWEVEPFDMNKLTDADIGRTVIYIDGPRREAGTLSSWRFGTAFVRYTNGSTAAGTHPASLMFGVRHLDGPDHPTSFPSTESEGK